MAVTEEKIKEYLKMDQTIILATIDTEGIPDIRTLGGYGISDYVIYFATLKDSNKVKQLENNSYVAVFIQHENQFIAKFFNVTIYGKARLVDNEKEFETGKALITSRKPSLKIHEDTHYIFKILPEKIKALDFSEQNLNERVTVFKL
jgi:nitroimidazol reductase NimA-like FMN-containing flavoprotein (pyridoxamine 5'-phosphate oxidase superfamily)